MADRGNTISLKRYDVTGLALPWLHLSDLELELYSLNRLHPAFLPAMEEHLLVCPECAVRLEAFDEYHKVIKQALLR